MSHKGFIGKPPAKRPAPKEEKKDGKQVRLQRDRRKAAATFYEAGRGFGYSGPALQNYVESQMTNCVQ